jgi:hypothetical protein
VVLSDHRIFFNENKQILGSFSLKLSGIENRPNKKVTDR